MSEATIILQNMRGGCATVDNKVHALFRVNGRRGRIAQRFDDGSDAPQPAAQAGNPSERTD